MPSTSSGSRSGASRESGTADFPVLRTGKAPPAGPPVACRRRRSGHALRRVGRTDRAKCGAASPLGPAHHPASLERSGYDAGAMLCMPV